MKTEIIKPYQKNVKLTALEYIVLMWRYYCNILIIIYLFAKIIFICLV